MLRNTYINNTEFVECGSTKLLNDLKREIYADLTHSKQRMREKTIHIYIQKTEKWVQFKCIHWGKNLLMMIETNTSSN